MEEEEDSNCGPIPLFADLYGKQFVFNYNDKSRNYTIQTIVGIGKTVFWKNNNEIIKLNQSCL